jgi:16S rRNA (uracil1498-N3)-methyltransferase
VADPDLPFFHSPRPAAPGDTVRLGDEEARHGGRSLRLKSGDLVILADGEGGLAEARVGAARPGRLELTVLSRRQVPRPRGPEIRLAAAVVRGPRFDLLVEKATELGADVLVPLLTRHGEVRPGGVEKPERWRRLAISALKQSRRAWLPRIEPVTTLEAFLEAWPGGTLWVAEPGEPGPGIPKPDGDRLGLLVGPEGGWHPSETALLAGRGAVFISLGPNRLRTETAALALLVHARGALGFIGPAGTS